MSHRTTKIKLIVQSMFTLRNDTASYEEIENTIVSGAKLQGTNACILILAILVASIGLNMNSTAVIIGAMLISPLMGGITAIAYGIATNNLGLAKWSAFRLGVQVLISIVTSCIYFSISPITDASSELLARTSPTLWDVLIAVCGGLAGIIGQTRKEKSNVIPGVAIATALMPPLCTAGYGLAHLQFQYFFGALYLFFINGFFICLTAIIVLKYLRVPQFKELSKKALSKIHRSIAVLAIITMLPSVYLAYDIVLKSIDNSSAESYIKNEFVLDGTQVIQKNIDTDKHTIDVSLLGKEVSDEVCDQLKEKLKDYNLEDYTLNISQTAIRNGVTENELKDILSQYEESEEQPDVDSIILQRENEDLTEQNKELQQQVAELESKINTQNEKLDAQQLTEELNAINSKIIGAAASYAAYAEDGTENKNDDKLAVTIVATEKLSADEQKTIKNFICKRFDVKDILLSTSTAD